jgi:hypothetical protein
MLLVLDFPSVRRRGSGAAALVTAVVLALPASAAFATDYLPDLGMAHPSDLRITNSNGRKLLRYTAIVVNVGTGPFEVHGARPDTSSPMTVIQRIYGDSAGGYRDVSVPGAEMFYAGDGHNHWHVRDFETGALIRRDNGSKVGALAKHGFCFADNYKYRLTLPGAPLSPVFTGCGTVDSLYIVPGISVGWGDRYSSNLAYQYIDITGVPNGHYRLQVSASTQLGFQESNDANNVSWVDVLLLANNATIVAKGPAA